MITNQTKTEIKIHQLNQKKNALLNALSICERQKQAYTDGIKKYTIEVNNIQKKILKLSPIKDQENNNE